MGEAGYGAIVTAPPIQALIVQPDGTYEVRQVEQSLNSMRALLGGYIEAVDGGMGATFWVNEEGKVHDLPVNPMATYLWWKLVPEMEHLDDLRGTVVITGPPDEAGDSYPLLDSVLDLYRRMEAVRMTQAANEGPETPGEHAP